MTKVWCRSNSDEGYTQSRIVSDEWFESDVEPFSSMKGRFSELTVEITSNHPPGDYFQPGSMFVISGRLKSVFEKFSVDAEYFPVRVIDNDSEYTDDSYFFCNILTCVDGIDRTRGKYTFWQENGFEDHVDEIEELVIDEEKVAGHSLFCLAKGGEYIVCVCDELADQVLRLGFTGVSIIPPTKWRAC